MQRVYQANDILEANILKGLLLQDNIESYVGGFYLQGGVGEIAVNGHASVWVDEADFERASAVIAEYDADTL